METRSHAEEPGIPSPCSAGAPGTAPTGRIRAKSPSRTARSCTSGLPPEPAMAAIRLRFRFHKPMRSSHIARAFALAVLPARCLPRTNTRRYRAQRTASRISPACGRAAATGWERGRKPTTEPALAAPEQPRGARVPADRNRPPAAAREPAPYQPWAAAKVLEFFNRRGIDDPEASCAAPGRSANHHHSDYSRCRSFRRRKPW